MSRQLDVLKHARGQHEVHPAGERRPRERARARFEHAPALLPLRREDARRVRRRRTPWVAVQGCGRSAHEHDVAPLAVDRGRCRPRARRLGYLARPAFRVCCSGHSSSPTVAAPRRRSDGRRMPRGRRGGDLMAARASRRSACPVLFVPVLVNQWQLLAERLPRSLDARHGSCPALEVETWHHAPDDSAEDWRR